MMMKKTKLFLGLFLILSVTMLNAQPKDEFKPEVKIGGVIYTYWDYNVDNANFISKLDTSSAGSNYAFGFKPTNRQFEVSQNSFQVERAYINVLASLAPNIKGRVTPDVYSFTDGSGNTQFALRLKYAFVDWTAFKEDNGLSLDFTMGIEPNRWIAMAERYWGYRGFQKTLTDYTFTTAASKSGNLIKRSTGSYFSSADLGLEGNLNLPKGFGELYLNVFNGNGYGNLSYDNRFKDFMGSLFIHPLANMLAKKTKASKTGRVDGIADLTLGGFAYLGKLATGENTTVASDGNVYTQTVRNRFGGMLSLKYNFKQAGFVKIGGEFSLQSNQDPASSKPDSVAKTTASGLSVYLEFNPPVKSLNEKLMLVARYDMFDPNTANESASTTSFNDNTDKQSLLILGLAYKPSKVMTLGVTYQAVTYQSEYVVKFDGTTSKTDALLRIHGILEF